MRRLQSLRSGLPGTWVHHHESGGDRQSRNVLERSDTPAKPAGGRGVYALALGKRVSEVGTLRRLAMKLGLLALALLVSMTDCAGPRANAHFDRGFALYEKGDHDGAIAEYREAIRLRPDYAEAHYNLGIALSGKGDLDGAIGEYRQAIRLKPEDATAHYNLGTALWGKGDRDGAIGEYRQAIRLKPEDAEAHDNLGAALHGTGDDEGAIAEYRQAIRLKPEDAEAHMGLGVALQGKPWETGDPEG